MAFSRSLEGCVCTTTLCSMLPGAALRLVSSIVCVPSTLACIAAAEAEEAEEVGEVDESLACEDCGSKARGDEMLLCDNCDAAYHMGCLDPPLTGVRWEGGEAALPVVPLVVCPGEESNYIMEGEYS